MFKKITVLVCSVSVGVQLKKRKNYNKIKKKAVGKCEGEWKKCGELLFYCLIKQLQGLHTSHRAPCKAQWVSEGSVCGREGVEGMVVMTFLQCATRTEQCM